MFETYEEKVFLKTCDCDMYGAWMPNAILECMQEIAGAHTHFLNLGLKDLRKIDLAWIISRVCVQFDRMPRIGDTVQVETYPSDEKRMFFPRSHVFKDENGNEIGRAGALWLLMDMNTRRISVSEEVIKRMPEGRKQKELLLMPEGVKPIEGTREKNEIVPVFSDFDVNGHVNNTRYMRWCVDAIGHERMKESWISEFNICYEAELAGHTPIETELTVNGNEFTYFGICEGKRRFSVSGKLQKRN